MTTVTATAALSTITAPSKKRAIAAEGAPKEKADKAEKVNATAAATNSAASIAIASTTTTAATNSAASIMIASTTSAATDSATSTAIASSLAAATSSSSIAPLVLPSQLVTLPPLPSSLSNMSERDTIEFQIVLMESQKSSPAGASSASPLAADSVFDTECPPPPSKRIKTEAATRTATSEIPSNASASAANGDLIVSSVASPLISSSAPSLDSLVLPSIILPPFPASHPTASSSSSSAAPATQNDGNSASSVITSSSQPLSESDLKILSDPFTSIQSSDSIQPSTTPSFALDHSTLVAISDVALAVSENIDKLYPASSSSVPPK